MSTSSTSLPLPILGGSDATKHVVLVGNPNAGKTTLFNRLTGLRAKTANFPGTTVDYRRGPLTMGEHAVTLVDLPGAYSMEALNPEEEVTRKALHGELRHPITIDGVILVLDATNLERNLFLASQVIELGHPTVVALNMIDAAESQGLTFNLDELTKELGCPVIPISARTGDNVQQLLSEVEQLLPHGCGSKNVESFCGGCTGCQFAARYDWAEQVASRTVSDDGKPRPQATDAIDRIVTHKFVGLLCFAAVMTLTFMLIFWLAAYPMDMMDALFAFAGDTLAAVLPAGDFRSLLVDGVVGGVGGMLVFLPQILILFFMISLLEDSGYLARAAFVMDKLMHRVGLPGKAFVPMLAAHACAIPAIMSSRVIEDKNDRLRTILIIPLMTCSARVPVFAMVVALMFPRQPIFAALTFAGAYVVAVVAALIIGWLFGKTIVPGHARPLIIELPPYRMPSLRNALLTSFDRSWVFVKKAGTIILLFSIGLWFLATYPRTDRESMSAQWQARLSDAEKADDTEQFERLESQAQSEYSFAGRIGKTIEPAFAPLGFDWRLSVGVINSFAAREVIVSTLAVLYGAEDEENGLLASLANAKSPQGKPIFTTPTCLSMLVFYIFAMQCLPTLAVVKRELGGWKWPIFQFIYMSAMAYILALIAYQTSSWILGA